MANKKIKGRPSCYTKELAEEICSAIACSSKGIRKLCKIYPHWPCPDTIFRWCRTIKDFSDLYARAKEIQVEALVDELLEIADDSCKDYMLPHNSQRVTYPENIRRSQLRIETRKWLVSKFGAFYTVNGILST